jgi:uncharacterized protein
VQILRAADRVVTPWKNGGGVTREVAVWPPAVGLDEFGWRISIANVSRGGPFSTFAGVERQLAVIEGVLLLSIDGREAVTLDRESPPLRFAGDVPAHGTPHAGTVTDLNVMTRRGQFTSKMRRVTVNGALPLGEPGAAERADVTFVIALGQMTLTASNAQHLLKPQDAVCLEAEEPKVSIAGQNANCIVIGIIGARK